MKVRMLLAELGEEYEAPARSAGPARPDWYLQRYRFGTIPFLQEGDLELGESNAVLRYLARSRGEPISIRLIRPRGPGSIGRSMRGARRSAAASSRPRTSP